MIKKEEAVRLPKTLIGWQEWGNLPRLGLPLVKAKVDTGARTSALHAFDLEPFRDKGAQSVKFCVHPLQKNNDLVITCTAPLVDERMIKSSNGDREMRYVIHTQFIFGRHTFDAEVTLTSRHKMEFRMLLGRQALQRARFVVDPGRSFLLGKTDHADLLYSKLPKRRRK